MTIEELHRLQIPATEQGKNVFRVNSQNGTVMYYPSREKWQHRGKVHEGDVTAFRAWLKRHGML